MRVIQLGTNRPITYLPHQLDSDALLVQSPEQPEQKTYTEISVSVDSTLSQAVEECKRIWSIHTHEDIPLFIGYSLSAKLLADVLNEEYGGNVEMREIA